MDVATDLHAHTLFSDGVATPGALVRFRREIGISVMAVSDHDHFAAVAAVAEAADSVGMGLIPAAELTATLHFGTSEAEQFHVLGYFPRAFLDDGRLQRTALYQRGVAVQEAWRAFILEWVSSLGAEDRRSLGAAALELRPAESFLGLQILIDLIQHRRPALYDAFRRHHVRFWSEGRALFAWEPETLCDAIRADGGIDVIAHAARYKDRDRLARVIDYATGIEVYTSRHVEHVAARFRALAEEKGKLWTASSDDHQRNAYVRPPVGTPAATVERLIGQPLPEAWLAPVEHAAHEQ